MHPPWGTDNLVRYLPAKFKKPMWVSEFENISLVDVVRSQYVSVRLSNAILYAMERNLCAIKTVADYLEKGENAFYLMLCVQNIGAKSAQELDHIIKTIVEAGGIECRDTEEHGSSDPDSFEIDALQITDLVETNDTSVRLRNWIKHADQHGMLPFNTVGEYRRAKTNAVKRILKLPNVGKSTAEELDILINDLCAIDEKDLNKVADTDTEVDVQVAYSGSIGELIIEIIDNALEKRERIVVDGRFSRKTSRKTLEDLGRELGVTRERIRQIEKKALSKIARKLKKYTSAHLDNKFQSELDDIFFKENDFITITTARRLASDIDRPITIYISALFTGLSDFLDSNYYHGPKIAGWFKNAAAYHEAANYIDLRNGQVLSLSEGISRAHWPIRVDALMELTGQPKCVLTDKVHNNNNYSLRTINDTTYLHIQNVKLKDAMRFILRKHMRAMTLYEIQKECSYMFSKTLSVAQIGKTLSTMKDALIVDRGAYNLYENLHINEADLEIIRHYAEQYLLDRQDYISAKVIIAHLKKRHSSANVLHCLNGYSLHGILQDDPRFICMRGLMIGLATAEFHGKYVDLTSEITALMRAKSYPMRIQDIVDALSDKRDLLVASLTNMLDSSLLFKQTGQGTYFLAGNVTTKHNLDSGLLDDAIGEELDIE